MYHNPNKFIFNKRIQTDILAAQKDDSPPNYEQPITKYKPIAIIPDLKIKHPDSDIESESEYEQESDSEQEVVSDSEQEVVSDPINVDTKSPVEGDNESIGGGNKTNLNLAQLGKNCFSNRINDYDVVHAVIYSESPEEFYVKKYSGWLGAELKFPSFTVSDPCSVAKECDELIEKHWKTKIGPFLGYITIPDIRRGYRNHYFFFKHIPPNTKPKETEDDIWFPAHLGEKKIYDYTISQTTRYLIDKVARHKYNITYTHDGYRLRGSTHI